MAAKKKKKLRVAFRKNRQKRPRSGHSTREMLDEGRIDAVESETSRLSGKGELTRFRTILADEDQAGSIQRAVDESGCFNGRVIASAGLNSLVEIEDGRRLECTVRRVLRMLVRESRNAVVAGDRVLVRPVDDEHGVIERIEPRQRTISRESHRKEHVIVANVDQALIVVSAKDPPFKPNLIDRLLVSAQCGGVKPIICVNKVDLVALEALQVWAGLYSRSGYDVALASAAKGWGIERLRPLLAGQETVVTGQSGVGKSSLLNAIQPGLTLQTGAVSDWTRKGKHTTRQAMLLKLDGGGWVVDTPGIRQMQLWNVAKPELEGYFIEFRPFVPHCRFPDCTHRHEEECAIKDAVERDLIAPTRYASYLRLIEAE